MRRRVLRLSEVQLTEQLKRSRDLNRKLTEQLKRSRDLNRKLAPRARELQGLRLRLLLQLLALPLQGLPLQGLRLRLPLPKRGRSQASFGQGERA